MIIDAILDTQNSSLFVRTTSGNITVSIADFESYSEGEYIHGEIFENGKVVDIQHNGPEGVAIWYGEEDNPGYWGSIKYPEL